MDSVVFVKKNVEDEEIAVKKEKRKMKTAKENLKMGKLKKEKNAGSEDDQYPEGKNIQSIPRTESDLGTKLFGIFKMKENLEEKIKPSGELQIAVTIS